jgi:hypothetical protein
MSISLRAATPADDAFLREVYASARAPEMAMVPWSEEQKTAFLKHQFDAQDAYYRGQFPTAEFLVIMKDETAVGRIYILREEHAIRILDITLMTDSRAQGIGTSVIKPLLDEATAANTAVNIWVESFNPSQTLFRRLGFLVAQEDGVNQLLEFRAVAQHRTI